MYNITLKFNLNDFPIPIVFSFNFFQYTKYRLKT